jgi:hypothetical protein
MPLHSKVALLRYRIVINIGWVRMECRYLLDRRGTLLYFQSSFRNYFGNGGTSIKLLDGELRSFVFVDIS